MKYNQATIVLLVLFFASLGALWGLDFAGVLTRSEREQRADQILPDLASARAARAVNKIEIDRGKDRLVFETKGQPGDRWQMVEPSHVAAEPTRLDTLVRNLKDLRKSREAGTLNADPAEFGFAPPSATIRVFSGDSHPASAESRLLGSLELGKVVRGVQYVRASKDSGIDVVDAKLFANLGRPVADWRQPVLMGVPSFEVVSVTVRRQGVTITAERAPSGRWRLTQPIPAPANGPKVESLLAAMASLRVVDGPKGYVADDVKDFAPYGLSKPEATVELRTRIGASAPITLDIGKTVPGQPQRAYVRQGDQDDVVIVNAKALSEIPSDAVALRSQTITDFDPTLISRIEVTSQTKTFLLEKKAASWELLTPQPTPADRFTVKEFLEHLDALQASEFLAQGTVRDPRLDPPLLTIKLWPSPAGQGKPESSNSAGSQPPIGEPVVSLKIGRHDVVRKTIYAQLDHDSVVLAVPDKLVDFLPSNEFAFRDRTIVSDDPGRVKKLIVRRGDRIDELEPAVSGQPNRWHMIKPVDAQADTPTVTRALTLLTNLRVESFVSGSVGDGKLYGLDRPRMEVTWETDKRRTLKIGSIDRRSGNSFASLAGEPYVFTLNSEVIGLFNVEFHDHRVMAFPPERAKRVTLYWHGRTLVLKRREKPERGQLEWLPDNLATSADVDLSRVAALVSSLANLQTQAFTQYDGQLPAATALDHPRLKIALSFGEGQADQVLRIGKKTDDGQVLATVGLSNVGPVFVLPGPPWDELIRTGERYADIPDNPFATAP